MLELRCSIREPVGMDAAAAMDERSRPTAAGEPSRVFHGIDSGSSFTRSRPLSPRHARQRRLSAGPSPVGPGSAVTQRRGASTRCRVRSRLPGTRPRAASLLARSARAPTSVFTGGFTGTIGRLRRTARWQRLCPRVLPYATSPKRSSAGSRSMADIERAALPLRVGRDRLERDAGVRGPLSDLLERRQARWER